MKANHVTRQAPRLTRSSLLTARQIGLALAGASALCMAPLHAQEAAFLSRPISIMVGTPAGGFADIVARLLGPVISERVNQTVLIENKPGAGTAIGITAVARAKPDGHTIGIALNSAITMLPFMTDLQYDPVKDLAAIGLVGNIYTVWVVTPNSRFKTMADVVAEAKAKPGTVSFGYIGGGNKLTLARFEAATGARFNQVPYAAGSTAVTALLGGHVDVTNDAIGPGAPMVKQGKTHALAVTALKPLPQLPGVGTLADTVPGLQQPSWYGFIAPTGTPTDRIARLNSEINNALRQPKVVETLNTYALEIAPSTPEEFAAQIRREVAANGPLIKQYGITN